MTTGDTLAEAIVGAELRADVIEQKRASITVAGPNESQLPPAPPISEEGNAFENLPTAEEMTTLRRVPNKIPLQVFTIAFIELCERFSFYGSTAVCKSPSVHFPRSTRGDFVPEPFLITLLVTNFIQQPLPDGSRTGADKDQAGALGMGQQAATGITTYNQFWQYFMPLFGAFVADQYWGRYKTISVALGVDLVGHIILILSAIPPIIVHKDGALACLIIAVIVIGFGTGGFKPNIRYVSPPNISSAFIQR